MKKKTKTKQKQKQNLTKTSTNWKFIAGILFITVGDNER